MAALYAKKPGEEPASRTKDISTETAAGRDLATKDRAVVQFLVARRPPATLELSAVEAEAEALLCTTWQGVAPVLDVSGPNLKRQPVPTRWLKH